MLLGRNIGSIGVGVVDGVGSAINIIQPRFQPVAISWTALMIGLQGRWHAYGSQRRRSQCIGDRAELQVSAAWDQDGLPPTSQLALSELIIQSGGVVTVDHQTSDWWNIVVGNQIFGNGAITVTGAGSQLVSLGYANEIVVGAYGTGALSVLAGGLVSGQRMTVGHEYTGDGTVSVDGAGSQLNLNGPAVYSSGPERPRLFVGDRGNGAMTVSNGGAVSIVGAGAALFVGDNYGASGPGATGTLTIQSGGVVTVDHGSDFTKFPPCRSVTSSSAMGP